jgi:hypothetical protein
VPLPAYEAAWPQFVARGDSSGNAGHMGIGSGARGDRCRGLWISPG